MLDDLLLQVNKPGRYLGKEWNVPAKDFTSSNIKFALCFPDLYEVGMSNLGFRIIYDILNRIEDTVGERFFAVDLDMERILRQNHLDIFSLESRKSLKEFDLVGFSLSYELNYTNVLSMLALGGIPFSASLRNENYPLVIAGGPCVLNPEPLAEFFDFFIFGEGEEVIPEIIATYRKFKEAFKSARISKQDLLNEFSHLEGVYVPSLYELTYDTSGTIREFKPKIKGIPRTIKKRFVKDLDNADFPVNWLVPYVEIIHDRITLELMRGCPNRCRFCQARSQYQPFRKRSIPRMLELAEEAYNKTGYEEMSLAGLSVSDYPGLEELLKSLICLCQKKVVGISLPSIKPKAMLGRLSSLIASIKKTSLTFAPEAATEKLRKILDKDFDEEEFVKVMEKIYLSGYQHIKLYFMTGLPFEDLSDLDGIVNFSRRISEIRRKINKPPANINISVNTLIPKPHTAFQWLPMENLDSIKYKQDYLKSRVKNQRLKISFHNRYMSFLEGVLSRGDRRLSRVIACAFKKGARFDAWSNHFRFELWQEAFRECGINPDFYLQAKAKDEFLPWDFLDTGASREGLLSEAEKISNCN